MSFITSKPVVGQLLPFSGADWSCKKMSTTVVMVKNIGLPPTTSQLNAKEDTLLLKQSLTAVSRREIVSLAGMSLAAISLLLAGPAEARMSKTEMKNKLLEKLRELREKIGLQKPEDGSGEKTSSPQKDIEVEEEKSTSLQENKIEDKTSTPQQENEGEEKKSLPQQESEVDNTPTPKPENEGGEDPSPQPEKESGEKSTPQLEKESEENSTLQPENGSREMSTPQEEDQSGEKSTPQAEDEGGDKSTNKEVEDGEMSTPQKKDESPLLPFLNLTEIEGEPLVEATLAP